MEIAAEEFDQQDAQAESEDADDVDALINNATPAQLASLLAIVDEVDALEEEVQRQAGENGRREKLLKGGL